MTCSHPHAKYIGVTIVLWCPDCGAIARTDGRFVDLQQATATSEGACAWTKPKRVTNDIRKGKE